MGWGARVLASNARGKEEANALFLVAERVRTAHLAQSGLPAREKNCFENLPCFNYRTRSTMKSSKAADECQNKEKMSEFHEPLIEL